ncbi:MAG: glycosyltransferase [Candidatus Daviesbacteria bacterium]|nr:glycosyltransferase [Candidatus Daviesbacteria bacterium]
MEYSAERPKTPVSSDALGSKEQIPFANKLVAVTNFLYQNYHTLPQGEQRDLGDTDGIRGDLAIQSIDKATSQGVQVIAADGGSSEEFLSAISGFESSDLLTIVSTNKPGRGPQRRTAFEKATQLSGKQAIVYFQPEKDSLMDYLATITNPIVDGSADIVVPARTSDLFEKYYPDYMRKSELNVNRTYNWLMHKAGLLTKDQNFDWFFGPLVFKNDPEIVSYFLEEYGLRYPIRSRVRAQPNPKLHSDGHYFPIIKALFNKKRVISVEIPFVYPKTQKDNEMSPERVVQFQQRRKLDASAYRLEALHFLEYLQGNPNSAIQPVKSVQ